MRVIFMVAGLLLATCGAAFADAASDCKQIEDLDRKIQGCTKIITGSSRRNRSYGKAVAYNNRGVAYFKKGDLTQAIANYDEAIRLSPKDAIMRSNRGDSYRRLRDYDRAMADLDEAIRLNPRYSFAHLYRGIVYSEKQDYDRALTDLDEALHLDPKQAVAYFWRGSAFIRKGNFDRALADLDEAIRIDPKYALAYNNRCFAYNNKRDYDRAMTDCSEAIRLNPNYAIAYDNRGNAFRAKGNFDSAIADYDEAIRLAPKLAFAYKNRGSVFTLKGDYDRAITDYDEALRLGAKNGSTLASDRINALFKKGDNDQAVRAMTDVLLHRFDTENADVYAERGVAYFFKGDYDRALADYDEALRLGAKNESSIHSNRAYVFFKKGNLDKSLAEAEETIRIDPKAAFAFMLRARIEAARGRMGDARTDADQALSLAANNDRIRTRRGLVLLALKDFEKARDEFSEALRLKPDQVQPFSGRGQAYEQLGQRTLALADYKKAIELKAFSVDDIEAQNEAKTRLAALEAAPPAAIAPIPPAPAASALPPVASAPFMLGRRVALVIGNSHYPEVGNLTNPVNDAKLIAARLRQLGFADVTEKYDLDLAGLTATIKEFGDQTADADWAVVYYAGHGIEVNGVSYLVPVDAKLLRDSHVTDETLPLDRVLAKVESAKKLRLVILDACRSNPFVSRMQKAAGSTRSIGRGLSRIEPESGVLVAYAAKHGTLAQDGATGNSPFAKAMATYLSEPGLEIGFLFRKVRDQVMSETGGAQEPFLYGSLGSEPLYFQK